MRVSYQRKTKSIENIVEKYLVSMSGTIVIVITDNLVAVVNQDYEDKI